MPDRSDNLHCLSFQNLQTELKNLFWNSSKCILKICQLLPEKSKILDFMMTSSLFGDHFGKLFLVILFFLLQRTYVPIFIIISLMVQILGRGGKFTPPCLSATLDPPCTIGLNFPLTKYTQVCFRIMFKHKRKTMANNAFVSTKRSSSLCHSL